MRTPKQIHVCSRGWCNAPWRILRASLHISGIPPPLRPQPDEKPVLLLAMVVIAGLEISIVVVQYLPQGRIGGLSWVVDR